MKNIILKNPLSRFLTWTFKDVVESYMDEDGALREREGILATS
jgi:hypothetical protein